MLRGTITLADRGAFLRACDRLGLPLFTVLNARPAARAQCGRRPGAPRRSAPDPLVKRSAFEIIGRPSCEFANGTTTLAGA